MRIRALLEEEGITRNELTFTAVTASNIKFTGKTPSGGTLNQLQYSTDSGSTWSSLADDTYVSLSTGDTIMFRGECVPASGSNKGIGIFSATGGTFSASGNIMSLLYGDNFEEQYDLTGKTYAFVNLFYGCTGLVGIDNLILPATTLEDVCYATMFRGCTGLTSIPSTLLPATTLASGCYEMMFASCAGLTSIPSGLLPATTLASNCYSSMFQSCRGLTTIPSSLLPATTLAQYCYGSMFQGCTGLTTIPTGLLPATTLADNCYYYMFQGCTGLTSIPSDLLPATTLVTACYFSMFQGCTNITSAPDLPATTLVTSCYNYMFNGCNSLSYIKASFTTTPNANYTNSWVSGVASNGIFIKNKKAIWDVNGVNGVPIGWTTQTETSAKYLTFTAVTASNIKFTGTTPSGGTLNQLQYSTDSGSTWSSLANNTTVSVSAGNTILFKGNCVPLESTSGGIGTFAATSGTFTASGNIMSLLYGDNAEGQVDLSGKTYVFANLFKACTRLSSISNLMLPATTLSSYCYYYMFYGCTGLTSIPSTLLPATTLGTYCYYYMFRNCTGLTTIPTGLLPATTLASGCYQYMFYGCTGLTTLPSNLLPATTLKTYCYRYMFSGCTNLTNAPDLPAPTLVSTCYRNMFYNCTKLNYIKCFATNISASNCTTNWVYGVASSGVFCKVSSMSSWTTGVSGIPSGWTVQNA